MPLQKTEVVRVAAVPEAPRPRGPEAPRPRGCEAWKSMARADLGFPHAAVAVWGARPRENEGPVVRREANLRGTRHFYAGTLPGLANKPQ
jgi:hypothetical protein